MLKKNIKNGSISLLSICIPTYNRMGFLQRSLASACNQVYSNKEILICDNCSTDGTEIFVNKFIESNKQCLIRYKRHDINIGMVANWKSCLEMANGDYFMILDDDNYLTDSYYLSKVSALTGLNQDLQLISCNFNIKYPNHTVFSNVKLRRNQEGCEVYLNYFDKDILGPGLFFCFYKTSTAARLNIFSEKLITHDIQAMLMMSLQGAVGFIEDYCGIYDKTHDGNVPTNKYLQDYFLFEKLVLSTNSVYKLSLKERLLPFKRFHGELIKISTWALIKFHISEWVKSIKIFIRYRGFIFTAYHSIYGIIVNLVECIKNKYIKIISVKSA